VELVGHSRESGNLIRHQEAASEIPRQAGNDVLVLKNGVWRQWAKISCTLCLPIDLSSLPFWQQLFQFPGGAIIFASGSGRPTRAEEYIQVKSMVWLVITEHLDNFPIKV